MTARLAVTTVPTMHCAECDTDVPAGAFCGTCGAHLSASPRGWARRAATGGIRGCAWRARAAAVCGQLAVSTPAAPFARTVPGRAWPCCFWRWSRSRCFEWQAPLIAVSALGFRCCSCSICTSPTSTTICRSARFVLTALLGVGLGVGWALLTGDIVAGSYDVALSDGASDGHLDTRGVARPSGWRGPHAAPRGGGAPTAAGDPRVVGRVRDRRT